MRILCALGCEAGPHVRLYEPSSRLVDLSLTASAYCTASRALADNDPGLSPEPYKEYTEIKETLVLENKQLITR
ncbi:hypothetical protein Y032_0082g1559 [Ancylostoma ceylanicum]|uniref:Uncharacterized protein n=1 Tax=Ancylostoma ceylanicum TaxID=53326 RepID=A0A016TRX3_9BILA|nr:hypothetical protein Y032_0082g1559 [Ancylostoma ceylanicum]